MPTLPVNGTRVVPAPAARVSVTTACQRVHRRAPGRARRGGTQRRPLRRPARALCTPMDAEPASELRKERTVPRRAADSGVYALPTAKAARLSLSPPSIGAVTSVFGVTNVSVGPVALPLAFVAATRK